MIPGDLALAGANIWWLLRIACLARTGLDVPAETRCQEMISALGRSGLLESLGIKGWRR